MFFAFVPLAQQCIPNLLEFGFSSFGVLFFFVFFALFFFFFLRASVFAASAAFDDDFFCMPFVFAFVVFVVVFATIAVLLYASGKSLKEYNPLVEKNRIESNQSARKRALASFPYYVFP